MFVVNVASVVSMINALRQSAPLHPGSPDALPDPTPWHALEARGVLSRLGSSEQGLPQQGAIERRREQTPEPSALSELTQAVSEELFNPLAPLLAAGAGLSAMVGSTLDAGIVAGVGGINALVSGVQRFRTEREIRRLVHPVELHVKAVRDGRSRMLRSSDLVAGDVIELSAGELVPADCRLIAAHNLEVDSSSLTGESLPSPKHTAPSFDPSIADRACMLYAGTEVVSGTARAVVVATGAQVEAQRGAHIAEQAHPQSGVEARLRELMALTGPVAAAGGLAVIAAGMVRGRRTQDLVASGVSMAVAAIPEGLPVLASAAQLSTARRLSREGALVRNARCIEALGRVDVICLDKTGTLTEGAIELHLVSDGEHDLLPEELGPDTRIVLEAALRASTGRDVDREHHDPTDAALLRAAAVLDVDPDAGMAGWHPRSEHPFESGRGYHAVVGRTDAGLLASVKGAPEKVIERCAYRETVDGRVPLDEEGQVRLVTHAGRLAAEGLRVLAVAERATLLDTPGTEGEESMDATDLRELSFLGFLGFRDPPREAAARTIEKLRQAGIEVVMLTGDHVNTARSIAEDVDMLRDRGTMTGGEVARLDDDELQTQATEAGVFARVTPAQKVRIVRALQASGKVVAMVGDGANDAPALRAAEVGVAVGERSAEAARAAADIVFADTGIETLCEGVVEARAMWLSVRDAVSILVGGNLGEIGFTVAGGLLSGRPPLNPRQILLVNFLTDVAPAMAVALRRPSQEIYDQLTEGRPEEAFQSGLDRDIAIRAVSTTLGATWAWGLGRLTGTKSRASTMALAALVGAQLGQTMLHRGEGTRVMWTSLGSWAALATIVQTPGLSQLFGCRPIGPVAWTIALGSSAAATGTSVALSRAERYASAWYDQLMGRDTIPPVPVRVTVRDADSDKPAGPRVLEMPDIDGLDFDV
jgi:cation-transporting ATPase I